MLIVHGTKAFRERAPGVAAVLGERSTTFLGSWYAEVLPWRSPVVVLVNEETLLPVLERFTPARTFLSRLPGAIVAVLAAHQVPAEVVEAELLAMQDVRVAPTANRSVVGMLTEFSFLAGVHGGGSSEDLVGLALELARTPCGPLYKRHISPDRELAARVAAG